MKSGIQIFLAYYLSVFPAAVILNSCASSQTFDPGEIREPIILEENKSPITLIGDSLYIVFAEVRITADTTYARNYDGRGDTVIHTNSVQQIRYTNPNKGMLFGFLIGIAPGIIVYTTAGLEKGQDKDKRRVEGIWLGAFGALIGVGFSRDAAPTDTIFFRSKKTK